jgi:ketosteroid isomerase-like protein
MSQENVEIVKALFAAWKERNPQAALSYIDPNVEVDFTGISGSLLGTAAPVTRGLEGLQQMLSDWFDSLGALDWVPHNFIDGGDDVIDVKARGRGSGVPVERMAAVVYRLRDGRVVGFRGYDTLETAAGSVGI